MRPVFWQFLLPQHLLSRITGRLAYCKVSWLKNALILAFINRYKVDMQLAQQPDPKEYPTFNAFFTRALRTDARTVIDEAHAIACPADGGVSQCGQIHQGSIFQAKGMSFSLAALLGGDQQTANRFYDGCFATIYLSPKDYHRVHMPLSGTLRKMVYIPGKLFSVNQDSVQQIPALFAKNERVVAIFDGGEYGYFAVILVGALIVASIETVWSGLVAPQRSRQIETTDYGDAKIVLRKGDEMGRFQLGSTVIVLFANKAVDWCSTIQPECAVVMGQKLGDI